MTQNNVSTQRLHLERDRLIAQKTALDEAIKGLSVAIDFLQGDRATQTPEKKIRKPRVAVSGPVMQWLKKAGETGLSAREIMAKAAESKKPLPRTSVTSLLSREKGKGILTKDPETGRYILAKFLNREPDRHFVDQAL